MGIDWRCSLAPAEIQSPPRSAAPGGKVLQTAVGYLEPGEETLPDVRERLQGGGGVQIGETLARRDDRDRDADLGDALIPVMSGSVERAGVTVGGTARVSPRVGGRARCPPRPSPSRHPGPGDGTRPGTRDQRGRCGRPKRPRPGRGRNRMQRLRGKEGGPRRERPTVRHRLHLNLLKPARSRNYYTI